MSKAAGSQKPSESQKARALWRTKAARDSGEDFYDPEREDSILGRNKTRPELWEEHQRLNWGSGQSFEVRGESVSRLTIGSRPVVELVFNGLWPRGLRHGARDVRETFLGKCLAFLGSLGHCAFAHSIHAVECSKEVWTARVSSSFSF